MMTPEGLSLIRFKNKESIVGETVTMYPKYLGGTSGKILLNTLLCRRGSYIRGDNNFEIRKEPRDFQAHFFHLSGSSKQSSSKDYLA